MEGTTVTDSDGLNSKARRRALLWLAATAGAVVVAIFGYLTIAMPGMDHNSGMTNSDAEATLLSPADFEQHIAIPGMTVVNVHIPYEGQIRSADLNIPYNTISSSAQLPNERSALISLYCKTGRMSTIAATTLRSMGYANVVDLQGGMDAWRASGRNIEDSP